MGVPINEDGQRITVPVYTSTKVREESKHRHNYQPHVQCKLKFFLHNLFFRVRT